MYISNGSTLISIFSFLATSPSASFSGTSVSSSPNCNHHIQENHTLLLTDEPDKTGSSLPRKKHKLCNRTHYRGICKNEFQSANDLAKGKSMDEQQDDKNKNKRSFDFQRTEIITHEEENRPFFNISFGENKQIITPYKIKITLTEPESPEFPNRHRHNDKLIDEVLLDKVSGLSIKNANNIKNDHPKTPARIKEQCDQSTKPGTSRNKIPKSSKQRRKEISMKDYHKYVAEKVIFHSFIRKQSETGSGANANINDERLKTSAFPVRKNLNNNQMPYFNKKESSVSPTYPLKRIHDNIEIEEDIECPKSDTLSVDNGKRSSQCSNKRKKCNNNISTPGGTLCKSVNVRPSSIKHFKTKSKSALSSIQRMIAVPFDRGKTLFNS